MLLGYVRLRSYVKRSVLTTHMTSTFSYLTVIAAQTGLHPSVCTVLRDSKESVAFLTI